MGALLGASALPSWASAQEAATTPSASELPPPSEAAPKPKKRDYGISVMGGIGGGATLLAGSVAPSSENANVGPAGWFGAEVGARYFHHWYTTVLFELTLFSTPKDTQKSVSMWMLGLRGGYLTNPEGFGFFADLGFDFRSVQLADTNGTSISRSGGDVLVGLGIHLKLGDNVRLFLPRLDFAGGQAGDYGHALFSLGVVAMYNFDVGKRKKSEE